MDGFKLYVTNTSTIPPDGYLCYEDPDPGFPNIIQTITCNQLGKYVIYYDDKGSTEVSNGNTRVIGPIVELCYVAINGCPPTHYGPLCNTTCPPNCNGPCELDVGDCLLGCTNGWTGNRCDGECHLGFYGNACLEPCSANCSNQKCNHVTGECIGGCKDGWQGFNCSQCLFFFIFEKFNCLVFSY
ncbi:Hypothetical predicted protein [Mytilus galloprovincialis]|uniref:Laminin EGF-like domain-containing protein n=1 Tax=Mytilus galloprovincialis TaxID=29158 RepID=A0A8B6FJ70_MYTGA|nr:Hypothetical predicted protein [Mytilus galloprovincialis]